MFDEPWKLALGLLTGVAFGFLLQKGRVAKFHVILGQLLLKDWTVAKVMLTAVIVGAVGVYALTDMDLARLHIKPAQWAGIVIGGVCFGAGMALFGYCPGTGVAACGEGRRDAMVGVLGMLAGAGAFVALYPWVGPALKNWGSAGEVTFPQITQTSPWLWVAALVVGGVAVLWWLERRERPAGWRSVPHEGPTAASRGEPVGAGRPGSLP